MVLPTVYESTEQNACDRAEPVPYDPLHRASDTGLLIPRERSSGRCSSRRLQGCNDDVRECHGNHESMKTWMPEMMNFQFLEIRNVEHCIQEVWGLWSG